MHVKLVIVGGKANKSRVSVELPTVIGRSREADLTIAHPMISRKHCELYDVKGLAMIRDLGSLNGLFVGGTQVSEAALYPNAEFSVGPLTFRIEYEYAGRMAAAPDATTVNETNGRQEDLAPPQQGPTVARLSDHEVAGPPRAAPPVEDGEAGSPPTKPRDEGPEGPPPAIAPPDGEMPDFLAWDAAGETEKAEADRVGEVPTPPPGLFGTPSETGPPSPEIASSAPPQPARPPSSTPASPIQQTTELGPQESAGAPDEPEKPPEHAPDDSSDEGSDGSATDQEADAEQAEGEDEGMFDLSLPPASPADEPDSTGPSEELDDFLKGLE